MRETEEGIAEGGEQINNLRYADGTVLIADSEQDMQSLLDTVVQVSKNDGLTINTRKTKIMVVSKNQLPAPSISIENSGVEVVSSYKYLGVS